MCSDSDRAMYYMLSWNLTKANAEGRPTNEERNLPPRSQQFEIEGTTVKVSLRVDTDSVARLLRLKCDLLTALCYVVLLEELKWSRSTRVKHWHQLTNHDARTSPPRLFQRDSKQERVEQWKIRTATEIYSLIVRSRCKMRTL
jgi:hypothetical protein